MFTSYAPEPEPVAVDVRFTPTEIVVILGDGREASAPLALYPRLIHASRAELERWEILGPGHGIYWPDLDEALSTHGIIRLMPSMEGPSSFAAWLSRRAGDEDAGSQTDRDLLFVGCTIANPAGNGPSKRFHALRVEPGCESTWIDSGTLESLGIEREKTLCFVPADRRTRTRDVGRATFEVAGRSTTEEVVFAIGDDPSWLGSRALTGLNLVADSNQQRISALGPTRAASLAGHPST